MAVINPEKIGDILRECAQLYVLPRYKMLADHEISTKTGPRDLVTQADLDVEAHLERVLPDLLPGSIVVGEEAVARGLTSLEVLKETDRKIWVVDPVDGTYNFANHKREFAIMLGLMIGGEIQAGWIFDVLGDEVAIAEKGSGAFMAGQRLHTKPVESESAMVGFMNTSFLPDSYKDEIEEAMQTCKSIETLSCAGHEYLRMAKGQAHFSLYTRGKPWDHIPGALIISEAGGYVRCWDGSEYDPKLRHEKGNGLMSAANKDVWSMTYNLFLRKYMS